jgi:ABC-2 type transport system ATP-binding protein/lipopolysaccharide transport system ATP-binding protein
MASAIEAQRLSKSYRLGGAGDSYLTIRDALAGLVRRSPRASREDRAQWALREIDLQVEEGEVLGVIGRNGAGKSTLLKAIARITTPTSGAVRTRGRVGALLEVGTGFHPELTGRENVFLGGSVLGMSRADMRTRFDEIVEFAGVERFLDTPVKRYSSGMFLRLAFAVAAYVEPPILVVDEVLAVGDAEFQARCLGRMSQLQAEGRTVVFVSHDLGAITRLCSRAVLLDQGRIAADGSARDTVRTYLEQISSGARSAQFDGHDGPVALREVAVTTVNGGSPRRGDELQINVRYDVVEPSRGLNLAVAVSTIEGVRVLDESVSDQHGGVSALPVDPGRYEAQLTIPSLLSAGSYVITVWVGREHEDLLDVDALQFQVAPRDGDRQEWISRPRLVQPAVRWEHRTVT